jgi:hypothetical protein
MVIYNKFESFRKIILNRYYRLIIAIRGTLSFFSSNSRTLAACCHKLGQLF